MMQASPTPVPDHGTGWGLLLLLVTLYGVVGVLGVATAGTFVARRFDGRLPPWLQYLVAGVLLVAVGVSGFTVLVAATGRLYDVVALLLLVVGLPLALVVLRRRRQVRGRLTLLAHAAMAWSLPFLVGFGVVAFVGRQGGPVSPVAAGALAVLTVVGGTVVVDRLLELPERAASSD